MKLKMIIVDLELSTTAKKRLAFGIPLALILASGALAFAGINWTPPREWSNDAGPTYAGPSLRASDLDDNFNALADAGASLEARVAALEAAHAKETADGGYSLGGTFCGQTAASYNGNIKSQVSGTTTGYEAAKSICQMTCQSPSAHMCSSEELIRSRALGSAVITLESWISTGIQNITVPAGAFSDCGAWEVANSSVGPDVSGWQTCSASQPIACCD
jgi:hypothetical protein